MCGLKSTAVIFQSMFSNQGHTSLFHGRRRPRCFSQYGLYTGQSVHAWIGGTCTACFPTWLGTARNDPTHQASAIASDYLFTMVHKHSIPCNETDSSYNKERLLCSKKIGDQERAATDPSYSLFPKERDCQEQAGQILAGSKWPLDHSH